jgi:hypothetical protein
MSIETVRIELTQRQVELLLKYTDPFDDEENQLKKFNGKSGYHILESDDFYAPRLAGDIVYSAKKIDDDFLLEELIELADIIESSISVSSV